MEKEKTRQWTEQYQVKLSINTLDRIDNLTKERQTDSQTEKGVYKSARYGKLGETFFLNYLLCARNGYSAAPDDTKPARKKSGK